MPMGRMGRPGLLGVAARTAVIAGTAQATSNAVNRRMMRSAAPPQPAPQQAPPQQYAAPPQAYAPPAPTAPPPAAPPSPAAAPVGDDLIGKLTELANLRQIGALTDAEFAAAKAKLLS